MHVAGAQTGSIFCCRLQIEESSKPLRFSQQLDKAVTTNYKPVANHAYNVSYVFPESCRRVTGHPSVSNTHTGFAPSLSQLDYEKKKKEEGKRARADKQQVLDMLFSAFEKHQYYNIKDLVDITKQPVVSKLTLCGTTQNVPFSALASDITEIDVLRNCMKCMVLHV